MIYRYTHQHIYIYIYICYIYIVYVIYILYMLYIYYIYINFLSEISTNYTLKYNLLFVFNINMDVFLTNTDLTISYIGCIVFYIDVRIANI